ncbi:MAG: trehalose-phosphatase [Pseudomonadota bacterium]
MTPSSLTPPPDMLDPSGLALFLDFDGTLVDIVEHPDDVHLKEPVRAVVEAMNSATDGAVAIVSGRDIEDVDRFLAPLVLPIAGVHGLRRRLSDGRVVEPSTDRSRLNILADRLTPFVNRSNGLFLERKSVSIALHYRASPELEEKSLTAMADAIAGLEDIHLVRGKMVVEAKGGRTTKGAAITDFLAERPFSGRLPVFAGDDITDEDGFDTVNARGGLSIKIGDGPTKANHRFEDREALIEWLSRLAGTTIGGRNREHA